MSSRLARPARAITPHRPPTPPSFPLRSILPFGNIDTPLHAPSMHTSYSHLCDPSETPTPPLHYPPPRRAISPFKHPHAESSSYTHTHTVPTPPSTDILSTHHHTRPRRFTRRACHGHDGHGPRHRRAYRAASRAVRRALDPRNPRKPNHTLSPYTRGLSHFTVRSGPRHAPPALPRAPPRARRRRTHVFSAAAAKVQEAAGRGHQSVSPPSEFDAEDMDRYFCTRDKLTSVVTSEPLAYGITTWAARTGVGTCSACTPAGKSQCITELGLRTEP
ncbi:hypothetical protein EDB86DRAFT_1310856 [Lactarius hatsudake]|nr:hypothetical protein EDB86DRAFT_1310856 [Lactarius hatsudake]